MKSGIAEFIERNDILFNSVLPNYFESVDPPYHARLFLFTLSILDHLRDAGLIEGGVSAGPKSKTLIDDIIQEGFDPDQTDVQRMTVVLIHISATSGAINSESSHESG